MGKYYLEIIFRKVGRANIFNYTKDGTIYLVHPWKNASNYIMANKIFAFPNIKKHKIMVVALFGREQIKVIASLIPIKSLNKKWKFIDITELENYVPYQSLKALHLAEVV